MKHRLMIVDDHPVLREGIAAMIGLEPDLEVTAAQPSVPDALAALETGRPDLVLVDISLGEVGGLELLRIVRERWPGLPTLVLSAHDETQYAERAMKAGARGYVMKTAGRDTILAAIRSVLAGDLYLSPEAAPRVLSRLLNRAPEEAPIDEVLTAREQEVFRLIGEGHATEEIARGLHLSPKTIRVHRNNIMHKLHLSGSIQLYQKAYQWVQEQAI